MDLEVLCVVLVFVSLTICDATYWAWSDCKNSNMWIVGKMKLRDYTLIAPSKKAVSLEQFNNDALWRETTYDTRAPRNKQADVAKAQNFREAIGTMYRCIDVRATTVAATPFMVLGEKACHNSNVMTDDTEYPWLDSIQALLALTEASLLLSSEAFGSKSWLWLEICWIFAGWLKITFLPFTVKQKELRALSACLAPVRKFTKRLGCVLFLYKTQ